jgi:polyisoprenoid-binding protein YceI
MVINHSQKTDPSVGPYEALTGVYTIDPMHSTVGFSVRHAMISNVRGKFDSFEGLIKLDGARPSRSEAHVSVETERLDTGIRDRDAHLRGPDFFDSAMFPLMTFRSTGVVDSGGGEFRMDGNLKIRDVELPITIDLKLGGAGRDAYGAGPGRFRGHSHPEALRLGTHLEHGAGNGGRPGQRQGDAEPRHLGGADRPDDRCLTSGRMPAHRTSMTGVRPADPISSGLYPGRTRDDPSI